MKLKIHLGIFPLHKKDFHLCWLMKLSKNASDILVQKYLELEKSHKGKFHNAPSLKQAYITDMLQEIIDSDYLVEPIIIEGKWCEIDTMQDIEYARRIFK